jgi:murein L,D-transpeptidase YcbB/YkuD
MRRWIFLLALAGWAMGQDRAVPLFTIEKSSNANRVQYEARVKADGHIDPNQPVVAYWLMAAENGRRQELNLLERARAYGFTLHRDGLDSYRLRVVSHPEKEIHVFRDGLTVRAEAVIGGRAARVEKIFIQMHKSFLLSLPDFGEMFGFDKETGEKRHERVLRTEP